MQKALVKLGYLAEFATEPLAALARVRAQQKYFSLVLTDQTMPGMTGLQFAGQLRQICPGLPVLMMTGYAASHLTEGMATAGIRELLPKPISVRAVAIAVHAALSAA